MHTKICKQNSWSFGVFTIIYIYVKVVHGGMVDGRSSIKVVIDYKKEHPTYVQKVYVDTGEGTGDVQLFPWISERVEVEDSSHKPKTTACLKSSYSYVLCLHSSSASCLGRLTNLASRSSFNKRSELLFIQTWCIVVRELDYHLFDCIVYCFNSQAMCGTLFQVQLNLATMSHQSQTAVNQRGMYTSRRMGSRWLASIAWSVCMIANTQVKLNCLELWLKQTC